MNNISLLSIIAPALAVLVAPIFSYWALAKFNQKKDRQGLKDRCFFTLFNYRASPMEREFVNALNSISLIFKNKKGIIKLWRNLINHLNTNSSEKNWFDRCFELRCDLIAEISKETSYQEYSVNDVKNDAYTPVGYAQNEILFKSIPTNIKVIAEALKEQAEQTCPSGEHV